jgi:glycosyltransferase involved in cell wall biosynthesis
MTEVSVVVPTRDRRSLLAVTLASVLRQRAVDLEVIVVDDASVDRTPRFVSELADPRITLLRHDAPRGPAAARNLGAGRARGEWVAFIDDDDVWAPHKLTRQLTAARMAGAGWVFAGVVNVDLRLSIVSGSPPPTPAEVVATLPRANPIPGGGSNVVVASELLRAVGGFDERLAPCEDWELWARLAERSEPAAAPEPLVAYRLHAGSLSLDVDRILRAVSMIEEIHETQVDRGRLHRWLAESYLRADRHAAALAQFGRAAVRGDPFGALGDVAAIANRRVRRTLGRSPGDGDPSTVPWARAAETWLRELADATTNDVAGRKAPDG